MDFHRGARHLEDFRKILGRKEYLNTDVNVGKIVKTVFQRYKKDVGKRDPVKTKNLLDTVEKWTCVSFGQDVQSQLSKLTTTGQLPVNRTWAILYCLRFMDDPDYTRGRSKWPTALDYAEEIERLILLQGSKGQRTYRSIHGGKSPPHPEDRHPKEPLDPNRLPPRFFDFRPPENFQKERDEFHEVRTTLIEDNTRSVAVAGPGGYGKTAIAEEIAIDPDIRRTFPGGVYWLQFGLRFGGSGMELEGYINTQEAITRLVEGHYPDVDTRLFDLGTPEKLFDTLPDDRILIIADDIWNGAQASILRSVPDRITFLVTTRSNDVSKGTAQPIPVNSLGADPSFALLTYGMGPLTEAQDVTLRKLCNKFHGWPLLLNLANGHFRKIDDEGGSIEEVIQEYTEVFQSESVVGWDDPEPGVNDNQKQRRVLVGLCIETGLSAVLLSEQRRLFEALAVFPNDTDIPFAAAELLWVEMSKDLKKNEQVRPSLLRLRAQNYSLFREFESGKKTFRLHDEMSQYLRGTFTSSKYRQLHQSLVDALSRTCGGSWPKLPRENKYAWRYLLTHMEKCEREKEADALRLHLPWLSESLAVLGASGLQHALSGKSIGADAQAVLRVLKLAGGLLDEFPASLAHELYGRLSHESSVQLRTLAKSALKHPQCWPHPRQPHLNALGAEIVRFTGHNGPVNHAILDPTGDHVLTASDDTMVRRWSAETGELLAQYEGHQAAVFSVATDQLGQKLVTASADRTARLWCTNSESEIQRFEGHQAAVNAAVFDKNAERVFTTSSDGMTRMWCARSGAKLAQFSGECSSLVESIFQGSHTRIVTIHGDCAYIWTTNPKDTPKKLEGHTDQVATATISSDGKKVLTASWDGSARIWSATTGEQLVVFPCEAYDLLSAQFNPENTHILTSSILKAFDYWSIEKGDRLCCADGLIPSNLGAIVFDDTSKHTIAIRLQKIICIKSLESGHEVATIRNHHSQINSATFDRSGAKILTASNDGTARLWSKDKAIEAGLQRRQDFRIWNAVYHPNSSYLATACSDNLVRIINSRSFAEHQCIGNRAHSIQQEGILDVAFDSSGEFILASSAQGDVCIWSAHSGVKMKSFPQQNSWVKTARFDVDSKRIVVACGDGNIKVLDTVTGAEIAKRKTHHGEVLSAIFSSDGSQILSAHRGKVARIWSSTDFSTLQSLVGHDAWVESAVFDDEGQRVLTASGDGTARLWSVANGSQIRIFSGHNGEVRSAVFDLSETFVLTASEDRTLRIWSTESGQELRRIRFDDPVKFIALSPKSFTVGCGGDRLFAFDLIP